MQCQRDWSFRTGILFRIEIKQPYLCFYAFWLAQERLNNIQINYSFFFSFPFSLSIGCKVLENGLLFKELLQTPNFRITVVDDADAVEVCGALKVRLTGCR